MTIGANSTSDESGAPYRPVRFFSPDVELRPIEGGTLIMRSKEPLGAYDLRVGDWLDRWAQDAPDRIFLVEQTQSGERRITYGETRSRVLAIAEGLLSYDLSAERPLIIIAPPGIDHGLMMIAAYYVGVPLAPVAPAYALQSSDFAKLKRVVAMLTPGMVAVADGAAYRAALDATLTTGVTIVAFANPMADQQLTLAALSGDGTRLSLVAAAANGVGNDTIAKFLFTSGSSGNPKVVINTHGMLCAAAQMQRQVTAFLASEPPIMVDWLPWNHTAGGNSIFNITLHNGGTLYIDPGKPTPEHIGATLDLLRRVSPTLYFNVPLGFEILLPYLRSDRQLSESFFRNLKFIWYAGAAMQPSTWHALEDIATQTVGQRLLIVTGLGMTETSPAAIFGNLHATGPGIVGVPIPGVELKLIRREDKFEALFRGPNVTPGYWRDPVATSASFDPEGFWISGDLLSFVDEERPEVGLRFEGRASDDFKLASGTRVPAGALRLHALEALAPLITDVVIVGADRNDVRMLMFPDWVRCAVELGLAASSSPKEMAMNDVFREALAERLTRMAEHAAGTANRIVAALPVLEPPTASAGELTDKGTINGRFLQRNRPELLALLFGNIDSNLVIRCK